MRNAFTVLRQNAPKLKALVQPVLETSKDSSKEALPGKFGAYQKGSFNPLYPLAAIGLGALGNELKSWTENTALAEGKDQAIGADAASSSVQLQRRKP